MLSNAYFLAKFRFDTAENEPAKKLQNFANFGVRAARQDALAALCDGGTFRQDRLVMRSVYFTTPQHLSVRSFRSLKFVRLS